MVHLLDLKFKGLPAAIGSFLIETSIGPVLIESGPHSTFANLRSALAGLGYQPTDVKAVLLTHIHLDHAGAAWALAQAGASVYVHPLGAKHLLQPERLMESARRIYLDQMDTLWGQMNPIPEDKLRVVQHGEQLTFGDTILQAWHTPGHAIHHIAWEWNGYAFTGDVAGVKIGSGLLAPPCPPPDIQIDHWKTSIGLLRSRNLKGIYLTHFGLVETVETHLDQLEKNLVEWADWMLPHYEKQTPYEELVPLFSQFVQQQLEAYGADELAIQQYEAANPSWMSVTGLLRYWKKKLEAGI